MPLLSNGKEVQINAFVHHGIFGFGIVLLADTRAWRVCPLWRVTRTRRRSKMLPLGHTTRVVDVGMVDAGATGSADKKRFRLKRVAVVMLIVSISAGLAVGLSLGFAVNRSAETDPPETAEVEYLPDNYA